MENNTVFEKLNNIIKNSSSKYYHYPVAAILECDDNSLWPGVNIETSSPQAGVCAERCAIFSAIANGYKKENFKKVTKEDVMKVASKVKLDTVLLLEGGEDDEED